MAGAIGAALFGLPVRTWFAQDHQLAQLDHQLAELQAVNDELLAEVATLQTPEGVMQAARETLGYKHVNENLQTIVDLPDLPADLPGWLAVRSRRADHAAARRRDRAGPTSRGLTRRPK